MANATELEKLKAQSDAIRAELGIPAAGAQPKASGDTALADLRQRSDAIRAEVAAQQKKPILSISGTRQSLSTVGAKTPKASTPVAAAEDAYAKENPYYRYEKLTKAKDFAQKSQYVSTENGTKRSFFDIMFNNYDPERSGWDDLLYEHINGNKEASAWISNAAAAGYGDGLGAFYGRKTEGKNEAQQMTDKEISIFNYLYATQGKEAAHEFYEYLRSDLYARDREASEAYWAQYAKENPVGSSAFSIATAPLKGLSYLGQTADMITTGSIDKNAPYNSFVYQNNAIRSQVAKSIEESGKWGPVGSFAYQTAMSMADFLTTTAISGGNGALSMLIMGSGAAADTTLAAKDRGLSDGQAFALGTIAGAAEAITERFSLESLLKPDMSKTAIEYILKNTLTEATEEGASSLINTLADLIISKDQSEWAKSIQSYRDSGKSEAEAFGLALADQAVALGLDVLGGAISGGFVGTGGAVVNYGGSNKQNTPQTTTSQNPTAASQTAVNKTGENGVPQTKTPATDGVTARDPIQKTLDVVNSTVAQLSGDPANPLETAVTAFRESGTVSNNLADAISRSPDAVRTLVDEVGLRELPRTASEKRAAIKHAVMDYAEKNNSPVDNQPQTNYDEITTTDQGGNTYASTEQSGLSDASETGLPGGTGPQWVRGGDTQQVPVSGQAPGWVEPGSSVGSGSMDAESGDGSIEVQLRVSPVLRVSDSLTTAQTGRGTQVYSVKDTTSAPNVYEQALVAGRNSNAQNGWCVTPKSAQELAEGNVRTFMNENGTVGVGIAPDGDIVAVFKNPNGGPKRALDTMMPIAIEQGGDRLDCYGEGLVRTYENYGFVPVARVEFNAEYANEGWTPDKGTPYIYFMVHNGDDAPLVVSRMGRYSHSTQEQLDSLPTYGKDDYDAAMAYRDGLIEQRNAADETTSVNTDPAQHTPQEQAIIDAYQEAVDPNLVSYIEQVKENPGKKIGRYTLKTVSDRAAADIQKLTGVDVSGNKTQIEGRIVEHILKDHGENGETDQSMRDDNDIARIQYVIDNYDSVEHGGTSGAYVTPKSNGRQGPAQTVKFSKKVNGTYYVVEAVPDTAKKTVFIVSAYMSKNGQKNSAAVSKSGDAEAPRVTPENAIRNAAAQPGAVAPTNTVAQPADFVNPLANSQGETTHPTPHESVGAAPKGFNPVTALQYEHGTIDGGEKAVRPDDLPKSTDGKDRVSRFGVTAKGAKVTPDEFVDLLDREVPAGRLSYIPITNNATTQAAMENIQKLGWEAALAQWQKDVRDEKTGAVRVATGALLLNNAAKAGDTKAWLDILHDYQSMTTNTAQAQQAQRILKTLSPDDSLYMIERSIQQIVEDTGHEVEVPTELFDEFTNAQSPEQRNEAIDKIQQTVADQLPSTLLEKWNALRYVNMLGNFKTQIRNVSGNLAMKGVSGAKDIVATGLENLVNAVRKVAGKEGIQRAHTVAPVNRTLLASCKADFDNVKDFALGERKYGDAVSASDSFARGVQDKRTIFKTRPMEWYRKTTSTFMEKGDVLFSKSAYANALARYLQANGIKGGELSFVEQTNPALLDKARAYAIKQAQENTFRDNNTFSDAISKFGRHKDSAPWIKVISEGVMPFRKTPANVAVRIEEYSPLGVVNAFWNTYKAAKGSGDVTAAIDSWAKSLTGSGLIALGAGLAKLGFLTAGDDEEDKEKNFDELNGYQAYSLKIGDYQYTVDWLSPTAVPLLIGAEIAQMEDLSADEIARVAGAATNVLVKTSMLQGLNDSIEAVKYSDIPLLAIAQNAAVSYFTQGITNTLLGQLERATESSRQTTYKDPNNPLDSWQYTIGKLSAKMPVVDFNQIPYIDAWGREQENPGFLANLLYQTLSPGYISKMDKDDPVYQELKRVNEAKTVEKNVYPTRPDTEIPYTDQYGLKQTASLTSEEWINLAKKQGQTSRQVVENLIDHADYSILTDDQKAKAVSYVYAYAKNLAKDAVIEDYSSTESKWLQGIRSPEEAAETIIRYVATGTTELYTDLSIPKAAKMATMLKGILPEQGYTNARPIQKIEAVTGADSFLSDKEQRDVLEDILPDETFDKYVEILAAGYSSDDFATAYRIDLDIEGEGAKEKTIRAFMKEFGTNRFAATKLYDLYHPKKEA